jgi:hypothetical protein
MKFEYLQESVIINEALKLIYDKEQDVIAAVSTEDDRKAASDETYRNKGLLRRAGFRWEGGRWITDGKNLENAKQVISVANKVDYLVDKLEDLEQFVHDASRDPNRDYLTDMIKGYIADLANETDEAKASEEIRRYLEFFAGFHQYSYYNKMLIYIQFPEAKQVASFKSWKERGRMVNRGSTGIKVLVPIFRKGENPKDNDNVDPNRVRPVGFKTGNVFDISQTTATSSQGEVPETPQWWGSDEPSEVADELYDRIKTAAEAEGIDVTNDVARHSEKGFSAGGHINITSDVEGVAKAATLAHEYAHELMHWDGKSRFYVGDEIVRRRDVAELQAESVSYVIMRHYNLPCKHSTTYLALWKATRDTITANIESISRVAHYIINRVDKYGGVASASLPDEAQVESYVRKSFEMIDEQVRIQTLAGLDFEWGI